jgi:hypothetical protein
MAKDIKALEEELQQTKEALAAAEKRADDAENAFRVAKQRLEDEMQKTAKSPVPTVTIGKVTKRITHPKLRYKGKLYTAEDIQNDKELAAELLQIGWAGFAD